MTETTIDGVRYYVKDDGGLIIADKWDFYFKLNHGIKMKTNKKHKGENVCRKVGWLKDKKSY